MVIAVYLLEYTLFLYPSHIIPPSPHIFTPNTSTLHTHPSHLHPLHLHSLHTHPSHLHPSHLHSLPGADVDDSTVKKSATIVLPRERNVSFGFTISGKENTVNSSFASPVWLHSLLVQRRSGGSTENRPITVSNVTVHSAAYK